MAVYTMRRSLDGTEVVFGGGISNLVRAPIGSVRAEADPLVAGNVKLFRDSSDEERILVDSAPFAEWCVKHWTGDVLDVAYSQFGLTLAATLEGINRVTGYDQTAGNKQRWYYPHEGGGLDVALNANSGAVEVTCHHTGLLVNTFFRGELQAIPNGQLVDLVVRNTTQHQFQRVHPSLFTVAGVPTSPILVDCLTALNALFNSQALVVDVTVVSGEVVGSTLTLTLTDASTVVVDVTSLLVDMDDYVVSGAINGLSLDLTMDSGAIVSVDITSMANGPANPAAPALSPTTLEVSEEQAGLVTIATDDADLVTMWSATGLSWVIINQLTGEMLVSPPAYTGTPSSGTPDVYTFELSAANPYGISTVTVTLNVLEFVAPDYINQRSIHLANNDYLMEYPYTAQDFPLSKPANMNPEPWTFGMWFKGGSGTTGWQTFLQYQSNYFSGKYKKQNGGQLLFKIYGMECKTAVGVCQFNEWHHIVLTYDGGDMQGATVPERCAFFKLYVDGVLVPWYTTTGNYMGHSTALSTYFYIGKSTRQGRVDEILITGTYSDQTAVTQLYNGGVPWDMSSLNPYYWIKCGDHPDDANPFLNNTGTSLSRFYMGGMNAQSIVYDAP